MLIEFLDSVKMKSFLLLLLTLVTASLHAAEPITLKLWPSGAPEPVGFKADPEAEVPKRGVAQKRLTNVSDPTIAIYKADKPNGTAVLVAPGGAYSFLAIEHEGTQVCEYLNRLGVACALLRYRVPARTAADPGREALQDAQRAMGLLRHHALELGLKPERVGILGFSAGGHLAVMATLHANDRTYKSDPDLDVNDATPNFVVLVYPAYLVTKEDTFRLRPEIKVTNKSPPLCIVHADDDKDVTSAGSALLYLEYKRLNLSAELHIYTKGGHGFGMKASGLPTAEWLGRVGEWMGTMGWLAR